MKSIKLPVITVFFLVSVVTAYAQENAAGGTTDLQGGTVVEQDVSGDGAVTSDNSTASDTAGDQKIEPSVTEMKDKESREERKSTRPQADGNKTEVRAEPYQGELLQINEGNFKYKRIPDIKLADTHVTMAGEQPVGAAADEKGDQSGDGGFLGMSKIASDIVVKGGILLFVFIIIILYKSRMRTTGSRKSGRKVLNSYRK